MSSKSKPYTPRPRLLSWFSSSRSSKSTNSFSNLDLPLDPFKSSPPKPPQLEVFDFESSKRTEPKRLGIPNKFLELNRLSSGFEMEAVKFKVNERGVVKGLKSYKSESALRSFASRIDENGDESLIKKVLRKRVSVDGFSTRLETAKFEFKPPSLSTIPESTLSTRAKRVPSKLIVPGYNRVILSPPNSANLSIRSPSIPSPTCPLPPLPPDSPQPFQDLSFVSSPSNQGLPTAKSGIFQHSLSNHLISTTVIESPAARQKKLAIHQEREEVIERGEERRGSTPFLDLSDEECEGESWAEVVMDLDEVISTFPFPCYPSPPLVQTECSEIIHI